MLNFLIRTFMWKAAARLMGRGTARNMRKTHRAVRLVRRLGK